MRNRKLTLIFFTVAGLFALLFLLLSITSCVSRYNTHPETGNISYPSYNGFVNDYTNTMSEEWKTKTLQLTSSIERETSCEIAVVIIGKSMAFQ